MVIGNTVYPINMETMRRRRVVCKTTSAALQGLLSPAASAYLSQIADVGISGIVIDVLTLSSARSCWPASVPKSLWSDRQFSWLTAPVAVFRRGGGTGDRTGG